MSDEETVCRVCSQPYDVFGCTPRSWECKMRTFIDNRGDDYHHTAVTCHGDRIELVRNNGTLMVLVNNAVVIYWP